MGLMELGPGQQILGAEKNYKDFKNRHEGTFTNLMTETREVSSCSQTVFGNYLVIMLIH